MAKSEIILWIVGIAIMITLGLIGAQVGKGSNDMSKNTVISGEVNNIKNASATWVGLNPILAMNGYCGINALEINKLIPNLALNETKTRLISNGYDTVQYTLACDSTNENKLKITIDGVPIEMKSKIQTTIARGADSKGVIDYASVNNDTTSQTLTYVFNQ